MAIKRTNGFNANVFDNRRLPLSLSFVLFALAIHLGHTPPVYAQDSTPIYTLASVLPVEDTTNAVAYGDLNGDGNLDLIIANNGQNYLYLNDGQGNFNQPIPFGVPANTADVGIGDLNNDGIQDIVAYNVDGQSVVYRNDGAGNMQAHANFESASNRNDQIVIGDLDGDGDYDLVAARQVGSTTIHMNNGQGTLLITSSLPAGVNPILIKIDKNSSLDMFMIQVKNGQSPTGRIYRYLNNGAGKFSSKQLNVGNDNSNRFAVADMDKDGDLDFVVSSYATSNCGRQGCENLHLLLDRGLLGYASAHLDSAAASQITLADLDNDGNLDIATSGLETNTGGADDRQNKAYFHQSVIQLTATANFTEKPIGVAQNHTRSIAVADLNADGRLDVVVGGDGVNALHFSRDGILFSSCEPNVLFQGAKLVADIDGDAYLDIILQSGLILRNNRSGGFSPSISLPLLLDSASHVVAADLNGDGRLDLITAGFFGPATLLIQESNGLFRQAANLANSYPATSLATGDIDGDGHLDILIGIGTAPGGNSATPGQNLIYFNDGTAKFRQGTPLHTEASDTQAIALGDLDADGDLDIVVANSIETGGTQQGKQNYIYMNDGNGDFPMRKMLGTGMDRTRSIGIGDINRDGHLDLVLANYSQLNAIHLNNGNGDFGDALLLGQVFDQSVNLHLVDIDHDRDLDMIVANEKQSDAVYLNDGTGHFMSSAAYAEPASDVRLLTLHTGDLDRDGDLDLLADSQSLGLLPSLNDCTLHGRLVQPLQSPNRLPKIVVAQPGNTVGAGPYASAQLFAQQAIQFDIALYDPEAKPVDISVFYSLDGGGQWFPALPTANTKTQALATKNGNGPVTHPFQWDVYASNYLGQSDQVLLRVEARPSALPKQSQTAELNRFPHSAAQTFPIRVRGTQVRVVDAQGLPVSDALVYHQPMGLQGRASLFKTQSERTVRTNNQGYLQGRGVLSNGDQLVALAPITTTHAFTLYHMSAAPTQAGLEPFVVTATGVQTLTVSAANPLALFNIDISLEWDAHNDGTFLADLRNAIEKSSDILFDVSEGQVALGDVRVHQDKDQWVTSDVVLYASNSIHPRASMGGVVITATADIGIHDVIPDAYLPGQIHMGPLWDPFGQSEAELRQDWWLAFAHELSHYLFFLPDNYLGVRNGVLVGVDCQGSFMTSTYEEPYREFLTRDAWDAQETCREHTIAAHTTGRSDWETIKRYLPWLHVPTSQADVNPGPVLMPLGVTDVRIMPSTKIATVPVLPARNFDLRDASGGEVTRLREANAYLVKSNNTATIEDDYIIDLGSTGAGSDRIKVRGAQSGDQLCISASETGQTLLGCTPISDSSTSIRLHSLEGWQPEIEISPVSSRTLAITVTQSVQVGEMLHAQVLPAYGGLTQTYPIYSPSIELQPVSAAKPSLFTGVVTLDQPAFEGFVRIWLPGRTVAHEAFSQYYLSPGWGPNARAFGGANSSVWGPNARAFGGANSRTWGAHQRFMNAPVASGDGRVTIFNLGDILGDSGATSLQAISSLPQAPLWLSNVGKAYRFIAADDTPGITRTIAFNYMEREAPKGYEHTLNIYYLANGADRWQRLSTFLDTDENLAAAQMPQDSQEGEGIYALMATLEMPTLHSGWNHFGYPIAETRPIASALASLHDEYSIIYQHVPQGATEWLLYDPAVVEDYPAYTALVNDLTVLEANRVYWLYATNPITPYLAVGNLNPQGVSAAGALTDSQNLPPATFFGTLDPAGFISPAVGMNITATIDGIVCGKGALSLLNEQWVYTIQVSAAAQKNGCGTANDLIDLSVDGRVIAETPAWDNTQAHFQPLQATKAHAKKERVDQETDGAPTADDTPATNDAPATDDIPAVDNTSTPDGSTGTGQRSEKIFLPMIQ